MNQITLIQCTDSKRVGTHLARELYDESSYFQAMREWAEYRGDPWYILSAKYGLLCPNEIVSDYDEMGITPLQAEDIANQIASANISTVHITAGRAYTNHLIPELEKRGIDVINHFSGERIGKRKQLLNEAVEDTEQTKL